MGGFFILTQGACERYDACDNLRPVLRLKGELARKKNQNLRPKAEGFYFWSAMSSEDGTHQGATQRPYTKHGVKVLLK